MKAAVYSATAPDDFKIVEGLDKMYVECVDKEDEYGMNHADLMPKTNHCPRNSLSSDISRGMFC